MTDDEASLEGRINRNLFRTDSDSDSDEDDLFKGDRNLCPNTEGKIIRTSSDLEPRQPWLQQLSEDETNIFLMNGTGRSTADLVNDSTDDYNIAPGRKLSQRTVMHVLLEEELVGGSIADRLWPAAEFLASFVSDFMERTSTSNDTWMDYYVELYFSWQRNRKCVTDDESIDFDFNRAILNVKRVLAQLRGILFRNPLCDAVPNAIGSPRSQQLTHAVNILEIGAGTGLTGLEVAHQISALIQQRKGTTGASLRAKVLLTDLESSLPLLKRNIALNFQTACSHIGSRYESTNAKIEAQKLDWSNEEDSLDALAWFQKEENPRNIDACSSTCHGCPILILGSDCVYWESLHKPLENCLFTLLSKAPLGSMCLLAGMRRWKRDNAFYNQLGKRGRIGNPSNTGYLRCICLHEHVTRGDSREVMRIYAVTYSALMDNLEHET